MSHAARWSIAAGVLATLLAATGCGHRLNRVLLPDIRPGVRLDRIRLDPPTPDSYAYLARWVGRSTGRPISHFIYAIDPRSVDAVDGTWVKTTATQQLLAFPQGEKASARREAHVFVVRAVDDQGEMSDPQWFAVADGNLPPVVQITQPTPNQSFSQILPPTARIHWAGVDPDGQNTTLPVRYVFRLFGQTNPDFPSIPDFITFALVYPDSLRSLYAPEFGGWSSVPGETTSVEYENLNVGSTYLFVVTGFDEAGDYDPIFSAAKNMLKFSVSPLEVGRPVLRMFNEVFDYTYATGGWSLDASRRVRVDLPANQPVTVNWVATPLVGADIAWYRWALNPADLTDETPRRSEATDWHRWSARSRTTTSATVGPFSPPGPRVLSNTLFIEAEDTYGRRSLGMVEFTIRRPTFASELLFVDDTRLRVDWRSTPGPNVDPPVGPWPTAAELDTFLFARGGFPWNSYPIDPATGQQYLSPPGIFNGYAFDTLSTRGLLGGVPLSLLAGYRHVVWYTDDVGATHNGAPSDPSVPITALRWMSAPGQASTLAAYVLQGYCTQGGQVWLCGGGAALASLIPWNRVGTAANEYTSRDNELVPGRMMYDFAHWREGIQMLPAVQFRKFGTTAFGVGSNRPGRHWPPVAPWPTPPTAPDYSLLPDVLQPKNPTTDPVPPLRNPDSFFYRGTIAAEYIYRPTFIREDYDDNPELVAEYSTLDTLYLTSGGTALPNGPAMTYYHGRENQPMVFSGFNFWYFRRSQCIALVDWVLNGVWGIPRDPTAPREPMATSLRPLAGHVPAPVARSARRN